MTTEEMTLGDYVEQLEVEGGEEFELEENVRILTELKSEQTKCMARGESFDLDLGPLTRVILRQREEAKTFQEKKARFGRREKTCDFTVFPLHGIFEANPDDEEYIQNIYDAYFIAITEILRSTECRACVKYYDDKVRIHFPYLKVHLSDIAVVNKKIKDLIKIDVPRVEKFWDVFPRGDEAWTFDSDPDDAANKRRPQEAWPMWPLRKPVEEVFTEEGYMSLKFGTCEPVVQTLATDPRVLKALAPRRSCDWSSADVSESPKTRTPSDPQYDSFKALFYADNITQSSLTDLFYGDFQKQNKYIYDRESGTFYEYKEDISLWFGTKKNCTVLNYIRGKLTEMFGMLEREVLATNALPEGVIKSKSAPVDKKAAALAKRFKKYRAGSMTNGSLKGVAELVTSMYSGDESQIKLVKQFDTFHRFLIPTKSGMVYDCKTGKLSPRKREHMFTRCFNADFVPGSVSEEIDRFFEDIMAATPEAIPWLIEYLGYCMSGDISRQLMVMAFGCGSNGKSVLSKVQAEVMGGFYNTIGGNSLVEKNARDSASHSADLVSLDKSRFIVVSEIPTKSKLNCGLVKQLTGDDNLKIRNVHESEKCIVNTAKFWINTNDKPTFDFDEAMGRRIRILNFATSFVYNPDPSNPLQKKRIDAFEEVLTQQSNLDYFFTLCISAYHNGLKNPVPEPACIMAALEEYKNDLDIWQPFIEDRLVAADAKAKIPSTAMYTEYKDWFRENMVGPMLSHTEFSKSFKNKVPLKKSGTSVFVGYKLRERSSSEFLSGAKH